MAKRTLIQILTAFLYNGNLPGFLNGRIWQGPSKSICVPGLNCYSCPGALGACPLGALQSSLSGVLLRFPFYVLGLMLLFGLLFGRTVCGWLCPFGFILVCFLTGNYFYCSSLLLPASSSIDLSAALSAL